MKGDVLNLGRDKSLLSFHYYIDCARYGFVLKGSETHNLWKIVNDTGRKEPLSVFFGFEGHLDDLMKAKNKGDNYGIQELLKDLNVLKKTFDT